MTISFIALSFSGTHAPSHTCSHTHAHALTRAHTHLSLSAQMEVITRPGSRTTGSSVMLLQMIVFLVLRDTRVRHFLTHVTQRCVAFSIGLEIGSLPTRRASKRIRWRTIKRLFLPDPWLYFRSKEPPLSREAPFAFCIRAQTLDA